MPARPFGDGLDHTAPSRLDVTDIASPRLAIAQVGLTGPPAARTVSGRADREGTVHELSLCSAIADTVTEHAAGRAVARVRLRIGHFRQVVPETLAFCWGIQTRDTPLAGSELDIEAVPAIVRCHACGAETTLAQPVLRCDACLGIDVELVSGEELLVESIDVVTGDPAPTIGPSHVPEEVP